MAAERQIVWQGRVFWANYHYYIMSSTSLETTMIIKNLELMYHCNGLGNIIILI